MLVVRGHGQGTRLSMCLLYAKFVVTFVACVNGYEFSVLHLILLHQLCMGMDDASALVRALCLSFVHPVSRVCSMCLYFNMLVAHGHGRGTRLGTCLV